jgi:ribonucleoside-diphosphate reductase subunit M1
MRVTKRDGRTQNVDASRIRTRLSALLAIHPAINGPDVSRVAQSVISGLVDGISTQKVDELAAETSAAFACEDPAYDRLAARITVSVLHKQTQARFVDVAHAMHSGATPGRPLVSDELMACAIEFGERVDAATDHRRDYAYSYFGICTLMSGYLIRSREVVLERPQHMLWRVALGIHGRNWPEALETYHAMSSGAFTHASPTLFWAGTPRPQMASCFLDEVSDDSIVGIYDTIRDCANISKLGGGLGVSVSKIRSSKSTVQSTGAAASGIMPALRVFNEMARHVSQAGRRKGAIAVYIEPWHADVYSLIDVRKNTGVESDRARDIFPALWVCDLFMERVERDGDWTLMSPDTAPGLDEVYGSDFASLYARYEAAGAGVQTVRARDLWNAIITAQIETGTPYMLMKDTVNALSQQSNIGIIKGSNLCAEICLHVNSTETAVCNLASVALPRFVDDNARVFDFAGLADTVRMAVRNLDVIIDRTFYPTPQAENSNSRHRPVGVGVQGLADVFIAMRLPFDSQEARHLNVDIFECIYMAALAESCSRAREHGPYETYRGSPASKGMLQPDLYLAAGFPRGGDVARDALRTRVASPAWMQLRADIARWGLRNSVLTALMPTASTAQILGNTESFEPIGSVMFVRRTLAGEFTLVSEPLVRDLRALGLWTDDTRHAIMRDDGSVRGLCIPDSIRDLYRNAYELPQRAVCQMAAERAPFVDQSTSLNIHMAAPTHAKLSSLHFTNWRSGCKTSLYYLRTRAAARPVQVTVPVQSEACDVACEVDRNMVSCDVACDACGA